MLPSDYASSSRSGEGSMHGTLGEVMRAHSTTIPDVVVLDSLPPKRERVEQLSTHEDLWLSTSDGRYNSPMIPLTVGQADNQQVFYVHKNVLLRVEYFKKALTGGFKESIEQKIELPEEDPAIFHFLVAYMYEQKYVPIKPAGAALTPGPPPGWDKGKAPIVIADPDSEYDSATSMGSHSSAGSRRRQERRNRARARADREYERMNQKRPGRHRPECHCPQCNQANNRPCHNCNAPRPGGPPPMPPPGRHYRPAQRRPDPRDPRRRGMPPQYPADPRFHRAGPVPERRGRGSSPGAEDVPMPGSFVPSMSSVDLGNGGGRIRGEDMRTWLMAYELNMDVYLCADRFLMFGLKHAVAQSTIDMLETAGADAAQPEVLRLCRKLYDGLVHIGSGFEVKVDMDRNTSDEDEDVPDAPGVGPRPPLYAPATPLPLDRLLRKILARVGFLQPTFWRLFPAETGEFLVSNPDVAALMLRETAARREVENSASGRQLPSMAFSWELPPTPTTRHQAFPFGPARGPPPPRHYVDDLMD